jgi:hypothetical protein
LALTSVFNALSTVLFLSFRLGRKGAFYVYMGICLACVICVAGLVIARQNDEYAEVITGLVLLGYIGTGGIWGLVSIIPMEAYPTMIRYG